MESQPQNPEFGNNPESFHPCIKRKRELKHSTQLDSLYLSSSSRYSSSFG